MTWAKFSTEFPDELAAAELSDAAYRTHSEAIMWLFRLEDTTLRLKKGLVRRWAGSADWEVGIKDLLEAGYWRDRDTCWEVVHCADVIRQSIQAQRSKRDRDRAAQKASRDRKAKLAAARNVSADTCADVSADTGTESAPPQTTKQPSTSHRGRSR